MTKKSENSTDEGKVLWKFQPTAQSKTGGTPVPPSPTRGVPKLPEDAMDASEEVPLETQASERPPLPTKSSSKGALEGKGEAKVSAKGLMKGALMKGLPRPANPKWQGTFWRTEENGDPHVGKGVPSALGGSQPKRAAPLLHGDTKRQAVEETAAPQELTPPPPVKKPWEEDSLDDEALSRTISDCKLTGIKLEIAALSARCAPSEETRSAIDKCVELLKSTLAEQCESGRDVPTVELCGSISQDTAVDGADVEVSLKLPSGEDRDSFLKDLREALQNAPSLTVSDGVKLYPHAPTPLTVQLKPTVCHIILSNQPLGSQKPSLDDIAKQLCQTSSVAPALIRLVKLWAMNHGLSNQHEGYMNGLAWTFLVLFYLQKEGFVPAFGALSMGIVSKPLEHESLLSLLRKFFEFLAAREGNLARGLSVTHAQEYRAPLGALYLEDPAEFLETRQQRNLAETVGEAQWARILDEARKAAERLNLKPQRWFHWAEIFDPREVSSDKMQRLTPLSQVAMSLGFAGAAPSEPKSSFGKGLGRGKGPIGTPTLGIKGTVGAVRGKSVMCKGFR